MSVARRRAGVGRFALTWAKLAVVRYADGGPQVAGAVAFRVLFSIFPLVIVLSGVFAIVVSLTGLQADVVDAIVDNVPLTDSGKQSLETLLEGATGSLGGLGLLGIVGLVWSATGMMGAIRYGLNHAWRVDQRRPMLRGKAVDLLLVAGTGVLIALSIACSIGVRVVGAYASGWLDGIGLGEGLLVRILSFLASAVLVFAATTFLYRVVPAVQPSLREVIPSAVVVGIGIAGLQTLFGLYLAHFSNFNAVYGSLGAIIAFLFFVYLSSSIFLVGANAAATWPSVRDVLARDEEPDDRPIDAKARAFLRGLVVSDADVPSRSDRQS